jgi:hypothetical protein
VKTSCLEGQERDAQALFDEYYVQIGHYFIAAYGLGIRKFLLVLVCRKSLLLIQPFLLFTQSEVVEKLRQF